MKIRAIVLVACLVGCGSSATARSDTTTASTTSSSTASVTTTAVGSTTTVSNTTSTTDPAAGVPTWISLPISGLAGRTGFAYAWADHKMVVWGGMRKAAGTGIEAADDGAIFDPASQHWTSTPPAPEGVSGLVQAWAWTGTRLVVVAARTPLEGDSHGAAFDPATGVWSAIAPTPLGARDLATSVWTGSELLVFGGVFSQTTATPVAVGYSPAGDSWTTLPSDGALIPQVGVKAVWTGAEVLLVGLRATCPTASETPCGTFTPAAASYGPASRRWEQLPDPPVQPSASGADDEYVSSAVWTGSRMVASMRGTSDLAVYDPATRAWARLAARCNTDRRPVALADSSVVQVCADGRVWKSADLSTWTAVGKGGEAMDRVAAGVVVGDGAVYFWGGRTDGGRTIDAGLSYSVLIP